MGARQVWVVSPDYGTEGLGEPWMVFEDEATADAVMEKLSELPANQMLKKVETSVWNLGKPPAATPIEEDG